METYHWWRCWWRLVLPRWEDRWSCRWRRFPPPGGKYPRQNLSAGEQKCSCPSSASRQWCTIPKVFSLFSRANGLIYQKMGAKGWPGAPWGTRACLGGWRTLVPRGLLGGPLWYFLIPIFFIYSKIILREISAHLEMCRIGIFDIAFSGPEFQLSAISLLV